MNNLAIVQQPREAAVSMGDMVRMAEAIAKSGFFGIKTADQALALMAIAQAEGLHPAIAARDYHVIQGKPALKADAMLARFQSAGGKVEWHRLDDECVDATFSHPSGGSARIAWDKARVKQAKIENGMHGKYPRQMLRARVVSEGIRTVFPGVVVGVYTPEEVQDFEPQPKPAYGTDSALEAPAVRIPQARRAVIEPDVIEAPADVSEQSKPGPSETGDALSSGMLKMLRVTLLSKSRSEDALAQHFGVAAIDALPKTKINEALAWARAGD